VVGRDGTSHLQPPPVRSQGPSARERWAGRHWRPQRLTTDAGSVEDQCSEHVDGSPGTAIVTCLRAAIAAPSIHNTQPWLFQVAGSQIRLFLDDRRRLAAIDPQGRAMHLAIGAALFNLRVAILSRGRAADVELLPDPQLSSLAAVVTAGAVQRVDSPSLELAQAIPRRRTNRRPFASRPVPDSILAECVAAALMEGGLLIPADPIARYDVLALTRAAQRRQQTDPGYLAELGAWAPTPSGRADGIPAASIGPRPDPASLPLRDFDPVGTRRGARFEPEPTIGVLFSRGDGPADWLRAGQALQRVLLTATARGVATSLLTQATEVAPMRTELAAPGEPHWAQAVIRFGYAGRTPRTPRRPLSDVLLPR